MEKAKKKIHLKRLQMEFYQISKFLSKDAAILFHQCVLSLLKLQVSKEKNEFCSFLQYGSLEEFQMVVKQ